MSFYLELLRADQDQMQGVFESLGERTLEAGDPVLDNELDKARRFPVLAAMLDESEASAGLMLANGESESAVAGMRAGVEWACIAIAAYAATEAGRIDPQT